MYETYTTVVGRMATAVDRHEFASGVTRVSFRVASNERRFDRATDEWGDGDSLYITVKCWRQLGENVLASMRRGDPVMVHGRLFTRSFERDGRRESVIEMEAVAVGPDLRWSTAAVTRTRAAAAIGPGNGSAEAAVSESPGAGTKGTTTTDDPWSPRGEDPGVLDGRATGTDRLVTTSAASEAAVQP